MREEDKKNTKNQDGTSATPENTPNVDTAAQGEGASTENVDNDPSVEVRDETSNDPVGQPEVDNDTAAQEA